LFILSKISLLLAGLKWFLWWLKRHSNQTALLFALGISLRLAISACSSSNSANSQASVSQQQVADTFFNLKLIPKQLSIKDVASYQNNQA
jgi:hypothetical protein